MHMFVKVLLLYIFKIKKTPIKKFIEFSRQCEMIPGLIFSLRLMISEPGVMANCKKDEKDNFKTCVLH